MKSYYVYILATLSGVLYTGVTNDLLRRVWQHRNDAVDEPLLVDDCSGEDSTHGLEPFGVRRAHLRLRPYDGRAVETSGQARSHPHIRPLV